MPMYQVKYRTAGAFRPSSITFATGHGLDHALRGFLDWTGPGRRRRAHPDGVVSVYDHTEGKRVAYSCKYSELRDDPKKHIDCFKAHA